MKNEGNVYRTLRPVILVASLLVATGCANVNLDITPNPDRNRFLLEDNLAETGERTATFTSKRENDLLGTLHITTSSPEKVKTYEIQLRKGRGYYAVEAPMIKTEKTRFSLSVGKDKDAGLVTGLRFTYRF